MAKTKGLSANGSKGRDGTRFCAHKAKALPNAEEPVGCEAREDPRRTLGPSNISHVSHIMLLFSSALYLIGPI